VFNQRSVVERLAQKSDRSTIERALPLLLIWVGGNQNDGRLISLRPQRFLQLKVT
jgi:hypothetical protein